MVKYAPRKVYIRESGGYVELSYTEFCRCRESDQTYIKCQTIERIVKRTKCLFGSNQL